MTVEIYGVQMPASSFFTSSWLHIVLSFENLLQAAHQQKRRFQGMTFLYIEK